MSIEELRKELKEICEQTQTSYNGIKYLLSYYMKSLNWSEEEAINYTLNLFKNGTIEQIKVLNKDGIEL